VVLVVADVVDVRAVADIAGGRRCVWRERLPCGVVNVLLVWREYR
jgi:hypothetical protein